MGRAGVLAPSGIARPVGQAASGSHWRHAGGIVGLATWMKTCGCGTRGACPGRAHVPHDVPLRDPVTQG